MVEQDHIAFGGGIGEWLYSAAGYGRDASGLVTLRAPEPWLLGGASVSRHVAGEGTTGWSWSYNQAGTEVRGQGRGKMEATFRADVTVPLGRQVEVWLEPPPNPQPHETLLVVRDEAGEIVWAEYDGQALASSPSLINARAEGEGVAVLTVRGGEYHFSAALETLLEHVVGNMHAQTR